VKPRAMPANLTETTIRKTLREAPALGLHGFSRAGIGTAEGGGPLHNWDRETKAIQAESNSQGWTRHNLRRTGATMLGDLGELPDIVEAALNHGENHHDSERRNSRYSGIGIPFQIHAN
jgi:hypothetical protein